MGFPVGYTKPCRGKQQQKGVAYLDARHRLIGNSWQVGVVVYLLSCLFSPLGFCEPLVAQQLVHLLTPGNVANLATLLLRPPLGKLTKTVSDHSASLVRRVLGLASVKGEDLLLQCGSEQQVKFHRLRHSIPAQLWSWRELAGWTWSSQKEHINVLEMRAILTTMKWLVFKQKVRSVRLLHLTDSLVCLHSLSRGRSSSRKLRRTIMRIQALVLAADLHPIWTFVHTSQNPADRPSRRAKFRRRKW